VKSRIRSARGNPVPVWILFLVIGMPAFARLSAQDYPTAQPPILRVETDKETITVGDPLRLKLEVCYSPNLIVQLPGSDSDLTPFDVRDYTLEGPFDDVPGTLRLTATFVLTAFQTGELEIPSLPVFYTGPGVTAGELRTDPVPIRVRSVLEGKEEAIEEIKPPMEIPRDWTSLLIRLAPVVLAAAFAVFLYRKYRRKFRAKARVLKAGPGRPAHETALEQLRLLEQSGLIVRRETDLFHTRVSEIIRRYLEERFQIDALEMTSGEILEQIPKIIASGENVHLLEEFLTRCDLVKFAKYRPHPQDMEHTLKQAYDFVNRTRETSAVSNGVAAGGKDVR